MGTLKIFKKRFYYSLVVLVIVIFSFYILSIVLDVIENFVITSMVTQVLSTVSSVQVRIPPYLYDIFVTCQQATVNPGQYIPAKINITNNGVYEDDIQIDWWLEDVYGVNYTSGSGVVNISYGEVWTSTKSLLVPSGASGGIYYYKISVTAETYSAIAYDTFEVQMPTTTTTIAAGSGIGGVITETETLETIEAGESRIFEFSMIELSVQEVELEVLNTMNNVRLSLEKCSASLGEEVVGEDERIYKCIAVSKKNILGEDIAEAKIRFTVKKTWFEGNDIDSDTIALIRYYNNRWDILSTEKLSEDSFFYYYESISPSLSDFFIFGRKNHLFSIEVSYNKEMIVIAGTPKTYEIKIKSLSTLHNLSVHLEGIEPTWYSIEPDKIDLEANKSIVFKIKYTIPESVEIKKYPVSFSVSSEQVTERGNIIINVLLQEICMEVEQSIENYASLIDKMVIEIQRAAAEKRNVTIALDYLDKAKREFDIAKELFESNECEDAKLRLDTVKSHLEKTIRGLVRTMGLSIIPSEYMPFINMTLIVLIALTVIAYKKRKKLKESKLYREHIVTAMREMKRRLRK